VIVGAEGTKETVNGMQEDAPYSCTAGFVALDDSQVVVNIDVEFGKDSSGSAKIGQCWIRL
jgi:hypothetical protein